MSIARLDQGEVDCVAGRTEEFAWSAYKADGRTPQAFEANDFVRFKLSATAGGTPIIDLLSGTPSDDGSTLSIDALGDDDTPASGTLILDQDDTAALSGLMHFEFNLVDAGDDDRIKPFLRGKMRMLPSQGGDVGT